jgi:hypothetical protein
MPTCHVCRQDNPAGARFCNACGSPLDGEARPLREERKVVTVLFADLVGFTAPATDAARPSPPGGAPGGAGGGATARPRLRRPALGGRRTTRLRGSPRRLGQRRPDPRARDGPSRSPRPAARLGRGARKRHRDPALAAVPGGDDQALRRAVRRNGGATVVRPHAVRLRAGAPAAREPGDHGPAAELLTSAAAIQRRPSEPPRCGGAAPSPGAGSGRCSRSGSAPGSPGAPARPPRTDPLG